MPRTGLVAATALMLAVAGCAGNSSTGSQTQSGFDGAAFPPGVRAPNLVLTDQDGQTVSLGAQHGKVVVVAFLWSDCRTCLLVGQQVRGALDELGRSANVRAIFVSTSPATDRRARARGLLAKTALTGRVAYLTGTERELGPIWRAYHVQAHSEDAVTVFLIDKHGMERVAYGVEQITPAALAHDIELLEGR